MADCSFFCKNFSEGQRYLHKSLVISLEFIERSGLLGNLMYHTAMLFTVFVIVDTYKDDVA